MRSYGGEGGHHADTRQLSVRGGHVRLAGPPADAHLRRLQGAVARDRRRPPAPRGLSAGALSAAAARSLSRGERREKGRRPEGRSPTPEMLAGIDLLLVDLQDVGTRVYTFEWTTALALEACAAAGKEVVVLDRPNPLGGETLEGNLIRPGYTSFVGLYPVPMR